ncbi:hypothetical protein LR69_03853 [Geobacillus sp. BCO2]|nr:hypothetical protein LR69_03853 [Geobacillus sp. BCO2]
MGRLNGMMYATMGLLLVMILEKPFIALSIPFVYYLLGNFITQVLGYDQFSPTFYDFSFQYIATTFMDSIRAIPLLMFCGDGIDVLFKGKVA